ncbi:hypothetical protein ACFL5V_06910 [Fibrobacterota bacterium]
MKYLFMILYAAFLSGILPAGEENGDNMGSRNMEEWVPVTAETWKIFLEEPAYQFNLAKDFLKKGEKNKAAFAIRRGEAFLIYQKNRLDKAFAELNDLAFAIRAGDEKDAAKADAVFQRALNVLHRSEKAVPVSTGSNRIFREAFQFHFTRAKDEFAAKNRKAAADELRRCTAFLKLHKAQQSDRTEKNFSSAFKEFRALADRVERENVRDFEEVEKAFTNVRKALVPK